MVYSILGLCCFDNSTKCAWGGTAMPHFYDVLLDVLREDERFVAQDGTFLRNAVYEAAMQMDAALIRLLLSNADTKQHFFTNVEGTLVFDKIGFGWVVNNRQFLPDSYTRFKNKIGLADAGGQIISSSSDVSLVFPYKDCVLEGGQTKEDQNRKEVFFNQMLAPDEVDRLLYPKVFTKAVRFDANGSSPVTAFNNDNLVIRGNNLLSLYSLLPVFEQKIKCIYIDPPYNTGDDEFNYNDSFNHSTWLVFMKNRLEAAQRLLCKDGAIFVQVDHHELGYLLVLMDNIFGVENKVQVISVKTASPAGFKTVNPGPIDVTEYILFYTKHKPSFKFKKAFVPVEYNRNYNLCIINPDDEPESWQFEPIKLAAMRSAGIENDRDGKVKYGSSWKVILESLISQFAFDNADHVVSVRDPHKPTDTLRALLNQSKTVDHVIQYTREDGSSAYVYKGGALAFYSNKLQMIDGKLTVTELLTDNWNHISWAGIANEGKVKLKNGKKPEKLLKQIFELSTEPGDIVLDYHLGSGTTCAVAHKMGLQYIGCEQLDYGNNDGTVRLQNVINGDTTGISDAVNWQGGGSFIYCELMQLNEAFADRIQAATTKEEMDALRQEIEATGFISCKVMIKQIDENVTDFMALSLEDQKRFLMELLDKNLLYVNLCDIDDAEFGVTEADKAFTKSFYGRT